MPATGTIRDVFDVTGQGTIVIVNDLEGEISKDHAIQIGLIHSRITAVEWPSSISALREIADGRATPWVGLYIEDNLRETLVHLRGNKVEIVNEP